MLPLPLTAATIESIDVTGTGYLAVLHLVGEESEMRLQTRWKERDERPTMVEASRLQEAPAAPPEIAEDETT
jgi:hypothetical protein